MADERWTDEQLEALWRIYVDAGMPGGYYERHDWTHGNLKEAMTDWGTNSAFDGELLSVIWKLLAPDNVGGYPVEGPAETNRIVKAVEALVTELQAARVELAALKAENVRLQAFKRAVEWGGWIGGEAEWKGD